MIEVLELYWRHARQVNFVLLILVLISMTAASIVRRTKMARRVRRIWFWFYLLIVVLIYGTADNIDDNIRVNPPVILLGLVFVGLFISMVWNPEDDDVLPPHDRSVSTRFVLWLDRKVVNAKHRHRGDQ